MTALFHGKCRPKGTPIQPFLRAKFGRAANGLRGNYLFATPLYSYGLLFSVKIPHRTILDSYVPHGDTVTPILVAQDRNSYLEELKNSTSIMVRLNSQDFEPQYSRYGIVTEWTRLSDLEIANDNIEPVSGLDEALDHNVQVLFVEDKISMSEFRKEFCKADNKQRHLMQRIEQGSIIWENSERGLPCSLG